MSELEAKLTAAHRSLLRWRRTLDGVTTDDDRAVASERVEFWSGRVELLERMLYPRRTET